MTKLHLFQGIQYQRSLGSGDLRSAYQALCDNLFELGEGGEICLAIDYRCSDDVGFSLKTIAVKDPPDENARRAARAGLPVPKIPNPAFEILPGDYSFEQLAALPEPDRLEGALCRFCLSSSGTLLLRILRENLVSFVAQILVGG